MTPLTWRPGPWYNIKMSSYQYRKSHCGDKTVVRSSYLHNGISFTGKMTSLYWIGALASEICGCNNNCVSLQLIYVVHIVNITCDTDWISQTPVDNNSLLVDALACFCHTKYRCLSRYSCYIVYLSNDALMLTHVHISMHLSFQIQQWQFKKANIHAHVITHIFRLYRSGTRSDDQWDGRRVHFTTSSWSTEICIKVPTDYLIKILLRI